MKDGVDRKGNHLYPAFPYDHFTKVKDADIDAIYAYLMAAIEPVQETTRGHDFGFPYNIRATLAVWKALFLDKTPFKPDPSKDAEWNEGAYLVEGLGHCAACHSPRNFMGARTTPDYGGGSAEGWYAPPLNKDNLSQQPWTKVELVVYLMDGWHARHGMAAGSMTPVVDAMHKQNEIDVFAIAAYVRRCAQARKPSTPMPCGLRLSGSSGAIRKRRRCQRNSARAPRYSRRAARYVTAAMAPRCRWRCRPQFMRRCPIALCRQSGTGSGRRPARWAGPCRPLASSCRKRRSTRW